MFLGCYPDLRKNPSQYLPQKFTLPFCFVQHLYHPALITIMTIGLFSIPTAVKMFCQGFLWSTTYFLNDVVVAEDHVCFY